MQLTEMVAEEDVLGVPKGGVFAFWDAEIISEGSAEGKVKNGESSEGCAVRSHGRGFVFVICNDWSA